MSTIVEDEDEDLGEAIGDEGEHHHIPEPSLLNESRLSLSSPRDESFSNISYNSGRMSSVIRLDLADGDTDLEASPVKLADGHSTPSEE